MHKHSAALVCQQNRTHRLLPLLVLGMGCLVGSAQAEARAYSIHAQRLDVALREFALQSGREIFFAPELTRGKQTQGVIGTYEDLTALHAILDNTGLTYSITASNAILVRDPFVETSAATHEIGDGFGLMRMAQNYASESSSADQAASTRPPQTEVLDEIIVTGTQLRGLENPPTATTVLDATDLQVGGHGDLGAVLADLPSSRATHTPTTGTSTTGAGSSKADLRGLGASRTLVLIDGRRPVPMGSNGQVSLHSIPLAMVERVEIVTGGASAAYGSDAVSGVVNVIMAEQRDGLRVSAQYGDTTEWTGEEYKVDMSYGFSFDDNRGHVIVGANHHDMSAMGPQSINPSMGWGSISNPDYDAVTNPDAPQQILMPDIGFANASQGGLIVGCGRATGPMLPATNNCGGLRDLTFEPDGSSRPFVFGIGGGNSMSGGDVQAVGNYDYLLLRAPVIRDNAYGRFTYEVTPALRLNLDAFYAHNETEWPLLNLSRPGGQGGPLVVGVNNAFLPAEIRSAMQASNLARLQIGRVNSDWALRQLSDSSDTYQMALGLEGQLGAGWSWAAFYSYGVSQNESRLANQPIAALLNNALDSVIHPSTGQPVCRIALTNPATSCVPLNIFGYGAPSQAAIDYVTGTASLDAELIQQEASAIVRGQPFSTWAGEVDVATGAEWRRLVFTAIGDEISSVNGFIGFNPPDLAGRDEVLEGFFEANVPLVTGVPVLRSLALNGAIRSSDYERAGRVNSWKIGLTNDATDELRLRFTRSRDIRAPNIDELYGSAQNGQSVRDPVTGLSGTVETQTGGNPELMPERATSTTFGAIYQPMWARGLNLSVDVFNINIDEAVTRLVGQDIVTRCYEGQDMFCDLVTRDPISNQITFIDGRLLNLSEQTARGVDLEISYPLQLSALSPSLSGRLSSRALVTYVDELSVFDGVTRIDDAGTIDGLPRVRATLDERYELGRFSASLRARYVGEAIRNRIISSDTNQIGDQIYFDLGFEYRSSLFGDVTIYGNVINLLDRPAPLAVNNGALYDLVGRRVNLGARMSF